MNIPLRAVQPTLTERGESLKERTGKIKRGVVAAIARIDDLASVGDAVVFDRDRSAAVTVSHNADG